MYVIFSNLISFLSSINKSKGSCAVLMVDLSFRLIENYEMFPALFSLGQEVVGNVSLKVRKVPGETELLMQLMHSRGYKILCFPFRINKNDQFIFRSPK